MGGRGAVNFDLSAVKSFSIKEKVRVQLRAEFFSAFNHANLSTPYNVANSASRFGRIESAADPRIVQLALRFAF